MGLSKIFCKLKYFLGTSFPGSPVNCTYDDEVQWSMTKYDEVQESTMKYYKVWQSTMKYAKVWWSTMKYDQVRWRTTKYDEVQESTMKYKEVCPSTKLLVLRQRKKKKKVCLNWFKTRNFPSDFILLVKKYINSPPPHLSLSIPLG